MRYLYFLTALCALSCQSAPQPELAERVEALEKQLAYMQDSLQHTTKQSQTANTSTIAPDSVVAPAHVKVGTQKPSKTTQKQKSDPPQKTPDKKSKPPIQYFPTDTVYHYYVNKKVSVKISPWKNDERMILLYDLYGNLTYQFEDVRHSYTVITDLHFHENGAVKKAITTTNPGASMYWYVSEIQFNTINEPKLKYSRQEPQHQINIEEMKPWLWSRAQKKWIKQDSMP